MKIDHIAIYVENLETTKEFLLSTSMLSLTIYITILKLDYPHIFYHLKVTPV